MADSSINDLGQPLGRPVANWTTALRPTPQPLVGRTCRLEPLDVARHGEGLWEAASQDKDGSSWTYLPYGPHPTFEAYREHLLAQQASSDPHFYAVIEQGSGQAVGVASFMRIFPEMGSLEIGHIYFSPRLQRTTAATEALALMLTEAFEQLGYRRVEWKCNSLNENSKAAALRLGFSYEGLFRQTAVVKGRNRDTAWYSIIDSEWPALADGFRRWLDPTNFDQQGQQRRSLRQQREVSPSES